MCFRRFFIIKYMNNKVIHKDNNGSDRYINKLPTEIKP